MTDVSLIYLDSTMSGHPQLSGTVGTGIDVLTALVSGMNPKTLTSLSRVGTTATATLNSHGFTMITTGLGPVIEIGGVNESGWNGRWRLTSVATNTFTFTVPDTLTTPCTGTITAKYAGAGWSKPFTGTNKAAFRSAVAGSAFLRIDDTATREMRVRGCVDMTDIDSFIGPFPTDAQISGGGYVSKSFNADGVERPWILVADGDSAALCIQYSIVTYPNQWELLLFGRNFSFKADDAYHDLIVCSSASGYTAQPNTYNRFGRTNQAAGVDSLNQFFARAVTQDGGSTGCVKLSLGSASYLGGGTNMPPYPPVSDGGIRSHPIYLCDQSFQDRGILRGLFQPACDHAAAGTPHGGFYLPTTGPLAGHTLLLVRMRESISYVFVDISGPWV